MWESWGIMNALWGSHRKLCGSHVGCCGSQGESWMSFGRIMGCAAWESCGALWESWGVITGPWWIHGGAAWESCGVLSKDISEMWFQNTSSNTLARISLEQSFISKYILFKRHCPITLVKVCIECACSISQRKCPGEAQTGWPSKRSKRPNNNAMFLKWFHIFTCSYDFKHFFLCSAFGQQGWKIIDLS